MRAAETALDAARNKLRIIGQSEDDIKALEKKGEISAPRSITARSPARSSPARSGPASMFARHARPAVHDRRSVVDVAQGVRAGERCSGHPCRAGRRSDEVMALPEGMFKARVVAIGASSDQSHTASSCVRRFRIPTAILKADMFASFRSSRAVPTAPPACRRTRHPRGRRSSVWVEGAVCVQAPRRRDRARAKTAFRSMPA